MLDFSPIYCKMSFIKIQGTTVYQLNSNSYGPTLYSRALVPHIRVIYKLGCHNVIRTGFSNQMITIWTTMLSIFGRVIIARNTYTTEHPKLEINKCYLNYCLRVRKKAMEDISSFLHKYPKKQSKKGLKALI